MTVIDARTRFAERARTEADRLRSAASAMRRDADIIADQADELDGAARRRAGGQPEQLELPGVGS